MEFAELRRTVLVSLVENSEGMTEVGLAALQAEQENISLCLLELCRDGDVEVERVNHRGHRVFVTTEKGRRALTDQRFAAKERKCLTCSQMFWSTDAGNRMCEKCKLGIHEVEHGLL